MNTDLTPFEMDRCIVVARNEEVLEPYGLSGEDSVMVAVEMFTALMAHSGNVREACHTLNMIYVCRKTDKSVETIAHMVMTIAELVINGHMGSELPAYVDPFTFEPVNTNDLEQL